MMRQERANANSALTLQAVMSELRVCKSSAPRPPHMEAFNQEGWLNELDK
jgi:hypothetical protein